MDLSELSRRLSDLSWLQLCLSGGDLTWIVSFGMLSWIETSWNESKSLFKDCNSICRKPRSWSSAVAVFAAVGRGQEFSKLPQSQVVQMSIMWEAQQYGNKIVAFPAKNTWLTTRASWIVIIIVLANYGCRKFVGHCWFWACPIVAVILQSTSCGCYGLSAFLHLVSLSFSWGLAVVVSEQLWGN